jgi:hypothetical protein
MPDSSLRSPLFLGSEFMSDGECSDGKTFQATLGTFGGEIVYFRGGAQVGRATYIDIITDCACSGEGFTGDVLCASPIFETAPPEGELRFPFADGHRAAPCLCAD